MKSYRVAVIAGDGIGKEVVPAAVEILKKAASNGNFECDFTPIPWGCDYYLTNGRMMDADGVEQLHEVRCHLSRARLATRACPTPSRRAS